jgi:hypothetical protein
MIESLYTSPEKQSLPLTTPIGYQPTYEQLKQYKKLEDLYLQYNRMKDTQPIE